MISPNDIPTGSSKAEIKEREKIIRSFYKEWMAANPSKSRYNISLKDYINIRNVSIVETSEHAAKKYLSTLAVLQLDSVLANARKVKTVKSDASARNQNAFEKMIIMESLLPGIGTVKLTVGVKRSDKSKVQYCITVLMA